MFDSGYMIQTKNRTDYVLVLYFLILMIFGFLVLSSAGVAVGIDSFGDPYFFIKRQLLYGFLPGFSLFFICAKLDYHFWKKNASLLFLSAIILLFLVLIPGVGSNYGTSSTSWFTLFGASFQPAELAKLALIIFLSALLAKKGKQIEDFKFGFLATLGLTSIPIALILLQPDLGTAVILFGIVFLMLYFAKARSFHLSILLIMGILGVVGMTLLAPYRINRLMTFIHPELDQKGIGYQINQAFLAFGSGGWFGLGLGHSRQKFQYLPEVQADSIFAILAEEFGFIIAAGIIILIIMIVIRGFKNAKNAPDSFGKYMIAGIMAWFLIQSFLNIGAIVGLLPLTGVPLPFISHGGTALMINLAAVGIITNISKNTEITNYS